MNWKIMFLQGLASLPLSHPEAPLPWKSPDARHHVLAQVLPILNPIFRTGSHLRVFGLTYQSKIVFNRPCVARSPFPSWLKAVFFEFVAEAVTNEVCTIEFVRCVLANSLSGKLKPESSEQGESP